MSHVTNDIEGLESIEQRNRITSLVFESVYRLGEEATLKKIKSYLINQIESHNTRISRQIEAKYEEGLFTSVERDQELQKKRLRPLSTRTVQRYAQADPRIEWDGNKYFISQKTRLELRDLDPETSGLQIFREIMNFIPKDNLDENISNFVQRFGAFVFFTFIEATRPLNDTFNLKEREYLVEYWARHAIPLDDMLNFFQGQFAKRRKQDFKTPMSEMGENNIKELLDGLKRTFPEIYSRLTLGRSKSFSRKGST